MLAFGFPSRMTSERIYKLQTNLLMLIFACLCSACVGGIQDYSWWPLNHSDPLLCPNGCSIDDSACCRCNAVSCWEIYNDICDYNVSSLHVEYVNQNGASKLLVRLKDADADAFTVKHTNGYMRELPANLCKFDNIVSVDFSANRIVNISAFSCLRQLEYLNLEGNDIQHLSKDTFRNLTKLRTLKLRNNRISDIEPYTFESVGSDFPTLFIDVSSNPFHSFDIVNMILPRPFCKLLIENVTITNVTNILNFKIDRNKTYGNGFVTLKNSYLDSFPNFTEGFGIGFDQIYKYVSTTYDFDENTMKCDCKMYDFMKHIPSMPENFPGQFLHRYEYFTCAKPEELKNKKLISLYLDGLLHKLTCVIKECPYPCNCYDQPHLGRVVVNCTGTGMTELPRFVPTGYWGHGVHLLLNNNNIKSIEAKEYLDRVTVLDLSNNIVESVSYDVFKDLPSTATIVMPNHTLSSLPASITYMALAGLRLGTVRVECNCNNLWLLSWRKFRQDRESNDTQVNCVMDGKLYQVESVHEEWLECGPKISNQGMIITISITSFTGLIIFIFCLALLPCIRYRLFDLKRWLRTSCRKEMRVFCYDIFLSFDDEDNGILFKWVKDTLITRLRELRYTCYIPFFRQYENIGYPREELTTEAISKSRVFIIILSDNYCSEDSHWTTLEQSHIWKEYEKNYYSILIVLNFDHFNMKYVKLKSLKNLLRVKDVIPFVDKKHDSVEEIVKRLPTPIDVASNWTEEHVPVIRGYLNPNKRNTYDAASTGHYDSPGPDFGLNSWMHDTSNIDVPQTRANAEVRTEIPEESSRSRARNGAFGSSNPPSSKRSRMNCRQQSRVYPCVDNEQSLNDQENLKSLERLECLYSRQGWSRCSPEHDNGPEKRIRSRYSYELEDIHQVRPTSTFWRPTSPYQYADNTLSLDNFHDVSPRRPPSYSSRPHSYQPQKQVAPSNTWL